MLVASEIFNLRELKLKVMDGSPRLRLRRTNRGAIKYKLACFGQNHGDYGEAKKQSTRSVTRYLVTGDRQRWLCFD
jgi:hypothetical protein